MNLYEVQANITVCVVGNDEADAVKRARADRHLMVDGLEFILIRRIDTGPLPVGWDGNCIPFGDESATKIKELWKAKLSEKPNE